MNISSSQRLILSLGAICRALFSAIAALGTQPRHAWSVKSLQRSCSLGESKKEHPTPNRVKLGSSTAQLALSSFGAALFILQWSLIDGEILSMGIVKAYVPLGSPSATETSGKGDDENDATDNLRNILALKQEKKMGWI
mmetsp:Transcript_14324/g.19586  ORF Transcript_14324/g.19586 Transcript_14324/m.19586 type:complete len:139 (+) Transcript_14324:240-656(+)